MKSLCLVVLPLAMLPAAAFAQVPVIQPAIQPPVQAVVPINKKQRLICRDQGSVGTMMHNRVCRTREQWDEVDDENGTAARRWIKEGQDDPVMTKPEVPTPGG